MSIPPWISHSSWGSKTDRIFSCHCDTTCSEDHDDDDDDDDDGDNDDDDDDDNEIIIHGGGHLLCDVR